MKKNHFFLIPLFLVSCHELPVSVPSNQQQTAGDPGSTYATMYVLNEGNWGANKASIDMLDLNSGIYTTNLYPERNPNVVKELGDCGSDIAAYGGRIYAVINNSHKVEVLTPSIHRIAQVDIPTPRYIAFHDNIAYITSYVSRTNTPNIGAIYAVDTASLCVIDTAFVGPQPDELIVRDSVIYCTCSGGYNYPNYDSTISVVNRTTMHEVRKIIVGINPIRIRQDQQGRLWVLCSGNYADVSPSIVVLENEQIIHRFDVNASNMAICGDTLYYVGTYPNTYGRIRISSLELIPDCWITDGSDKDIQTPYGLLVNPSTRTIYITDAVNYTSSGRLYGYNQQGQRILSATTGDVPAHLTLY
ncbi:MAG: YncE family protein [Bacteroidales bacterium]|nr:YncE family protein [Candidatus Colicola caccequi]